MVTGHLQAPETRAWRVACGRSPKTAFSVLCDDLPHRASRRSNSPSTAWGLSALAGSGARPLAPGRLDLQVIILSPSPLCGTGTWHHSFSSLFTEDEQGTARQLRRLDYIHGKGLGAGTTVTASKENERKPPSGQLGQCAG